MPFLCYNIYSVTARLNLSRYKDYGHYKLRIRRLNGCFYVFPFFSCLGSKRILNFVFLDKNVKSKTKQYRKIELKPDWRDIMETMTYVSSEILSFISDLIHIPRDIST